MAEFLQVLTYGMAIFGSIVCLVLLVFGFGATYAALRDMTSDVMHQLVHKSCEGCVVSDAVEVLDVFDPLSLDPRW
jgi:hypothetical protein